MAGNDRKPGRGSRGRGGQRPGQANPADQAKTQAGAAGEDSPGGKSAPQAEPDKAGLEKAGPTAMPAASGRPVPQSGPDKAGAAAMPASGPGDATRREASSTDAPSAAPDRPAGPKPQDAPLKAGATRAGPGETKSAVSAGESPKPGELKSDIAQTDPASAAAKPAASAAPAPKDTPGKDAPAKAASGGSDDPRDMRGAPGPGVVPSAFATGGGKGGRAAPGMAGYAVAAGVGALAAIVAFLLMSAGLGGADDAATEAELADLRERLAAVEDNGGGADTAALEQRIAALEEGGGDAAGEEIETLRGEVAGLRDEMSGMGEVDPGELEPLYGLPETVSGLEQRIAALEEEVRTAQEASDNRASLGVALVALQGAMSRGEPYSAELAALDRFDAVPDERLQTLRPHAETGVRTPAELASAFDPVSRDIMDAAEQSGDGVVDRIWSGAQSMVRIRPVGPVQGDSVGAVVSRIEAALADRHLTRALGEWETLPDSARAASQDWADEVRARIEAEAVAKDLSTNVLGVEGGASEGGDPS